MLRNIWFNLLQLVILMFMICIIIWCVVSIYQVGVYMVNGGNVLPIWYVVPGFILAIFLITLNLRKIGNRYD